MSRDLMEGSEAMARAAIEADCRFFSGYPMTPFTELLESFAKSLPARNGGGRRRPSRASARLAALH